MRRVRIAIGLILLLAVLCVGYVAVRTLWLRPFAIGHFFERAYIEFLWDDPELLSVTGVLDDFGFSAFKSRLTDASPARNLELAEIGRRNLRLLRGYDRERLTASEQVSYDVLLWFLETGVAGEPFLFHDYPVTHLNGPHIDLPQFLMQAHPITDLNDARDFLARMALFGQKFMQTIDALEYRRQRGIVPPTFILRRAIVQCDAFTAMQPRSNALYTFFEKKLTPENGFTEAQREELLTLCSRHLIDHVYPAYKRLSGYLMQLEDGSVNVAGVWHLPEGEAYYRHCLLQQTTLPLDPDELYDLGRLEMSRIEGEMRIILNMLGVRGKEDIGTLMRQMSTNLNLAFAADSVGAEACLGHFRGVVAMMEPLLPTKFHALPKSGLEVRPVPEFRQQGAPLAYYVPPRGDPPSDGRLYVNTSRTDALPRHMATTFAYHEGIPGHHVQKAIQAELRGLPTFRRFLPFPAFSEGWAMYAEELGHWMTGTDDPVDRLSVLQSDLWRTARMVTDVGIHHRKWLREQAATFLVDNAGLTQQEAEDEVDRYIVWPGQGCAYKVGKRHFLEIRQRYVETLGPDADMRDLHDLMLRDGAMPLEVLDGRVRSHIGELSAP